MDQLYQIDCFPKWKHEYVTQILAMNNQQLYEEMLGQSFPDDHDNCFTKKGEWCFKKAKILFERRMIEAGFINQKVTDE